MRTPILVLVTALFLGAPAAARGQGPPEHAQQKKEQAKERAGARGGPDRAQQPPGQARGQGQAQGQAGGQGQSVRAGQGPPAHARGRGGPAPDLQQFNRNVVEKAVRARGRRAEQARGVDMRREEGRIRVVREDGQTLFTLDQRTASELGYWRAAVVPTAWPERGDRDRTRDPDRDGGIFGTGDRYPDRDQSDDEGEGPPAFCRSGAGHPVWGRDWCIDKGFGLGDDRQVWGVDRDIGDIILRPDPQRDVLDRGGLIDLLGDIVFGRLALQSLVLGADEPLQGRWIGQQDGPRVLRVEAGDVPVAELVDYERDDQVDRIVFNLGG